MQDDVEREMVFTEPVDGRLDGQHVDGKAGVEEGGAPPRMGMAALTAPSDASCVPPTDADCRHHDRGIEVPRQPDRPFDTSVLRADGGRGLNREGISITPPRPTVARSANGRG